MLLIRRCAAIQQGFVLPLVMTTGLLLLLSGLSLQAMALQSLAQLRLQWQEAQQRDADAAIGVRCRYWGASRFEARLGCARGLCLRVSPSRSPLE